MTGGKSSQAKCDGLFEWKLFEVVLRLLPELIKHLGGQASGLGVLQAGVIGTEDPGQPLQLSLIHI